jgi:hypothetical protein
MTKTSATYVITATRHPIVGTGWIDLRNTPAVILDKANATKR